MIRRIVHRRQKYYGLEGFHHSSTGWSHVSFLSRWNAKTRSYMWHWYTTSILSRNWNRKSIFSSWNDNEALFLS